LRAPAGRAVDQDPPHQPGCQRQEVRATLDLHPIDVRQAQIRFVHERGGLQDVPRPLGAQLGPGHTTELVVDRRRQPLERAVVAGLPGPKQAGDVFTPGFAGHFSPAAWAQFNTTVSGVGAAGSSTVFTRNRSPFELAAY
jgi:hypothetical protein